MDERKNELEWYDSPNLLTNLLIGIVSIIIILSQAFAIKNNLSANNILRSIMNHNSIYLVALFYFSFLKTLKGKQYFNFLNVGLIVVYFCSLVGAFFTIFQSFGIIALVNLTLLLVVFIYLFHSFLKDTRIWKEFKLEKSPFNEISNDWYFLAIIIITVILLVVTLIEAANFDSIIIALMDSIYMMMFARFIYLYNEYLNTKELKKTKKKKVTVKDE